MSSKRSNASFRGVSGIAPKKQKLHGQQKESHIITDFNVERYAESRAIEIQALAQKVVETNSTSVFLTLPRHMRRRAMSHNIKRVPKRLRPMVQNEVSKHNKTTKRPSRKYRRRPSNLMSEYERRRRRVSWLETHIWHAKRFKMVEKWGYRLALKPNDKSVRACYRAVNRHCMMQDVSFESYIELTGARKTILSGLVHLTSDKTGLTFASIMTSNGTKQGCVVIYSYDSYPSKCIGEVTFLWKPQEIPENETSNSTIWICCHASIFPQALAEIKKCFHNSTDGSSNQVEVISLKDQLVKLRLCGPATNLVLGEVLQPDGGELSGTHSDHGTDCNGDKENGKVPSGQWWRSWYSAPGAGAGPELQGEVWGRARLARSASECPPHGVLGLTVRDPRLLLPPKRNKLSTLGSGTLQASIEALPPAVSSSPLWEAWVRSNVKAGKMADSEINARRAKHLIPGTPLELGDLESKVPVLLIQRPGADGSHGCTQGYSGGWDVLLPAGWAMAFWVACVYRGARVGGLREASSTNLVANKLTFPGDFPDTAAGKAELTSELDEMRTKYMRRPPAKRPNYIKIGIASPFHNKGDNLAKFWASRENSKIKVNSLEESKTIEQTASKDFVENSVLRERKILRMVGGLLNPKPCSNKNKSVKQSADKGSVLENLRLGPEGQRLLSTFLDAQVHVSFDMLNRGTPFPRGQICIPSKADLKKLSEDKTFCGPVENPHKDAYKAACKEVKEKRKKLRRQKRSEKEKAKSNIEGVLMRKPNSSAALDILEKTGLDLEIKKGFTHQESDEEIDWMNFCDRPIIGFVRKGDFDLSKGQGSGMGLCSVAALLHLADLQGSRSKCLVLVRNASSLQYRFATLRVVI